MMEFVNGKDDIPNIMENKTPWFQTTNQEFSYVYKPL